MNKSVILAATLTGFACTGLAQETMETTESSGSSFYTKFDFGAAFQGTSSDANLLGFTGDFETKTGFRFGAAGGMELSEVATLELESGFTYNDFDTFGGVAFAGDFQLIQIPVLLNVVFTLPTDGPLQPYAGVGAGAIVAMVEGDVSDSDVTYGWQVQAGVNYEFSEGFKAGIGYKLLGGGEIEWSGFMNLDSVLTHAVFASIRLDF